MFFIGKLMFLTSNHNFHLWVVHIPKLHKIHPTLDGHEIWHRLDAGRKKFQVN